jgi:hypothetical protein
MKITPQNEFLFPALCRRIFFAGLTLGLTLAAAGAPPAIHYRFDGDAGAAEAEAWRAYDYSGDGQAGGRNVFYAVTWERTGGVGDSGYIWADDSRWRIDTPEQPHSILAILVYQRWKSPSPDGSFTVPRGIGQGTRDGLGGPSLDLRDAEVALYLRGDHLDLKGAKVYFWVVSGFNRWHFTARPLPVSEGRWGERVRFVLRNDPSLWHRSWTNEARPPDLDHVLGHVASYGLAFVGFSAEVTGRLALDELEIGKPRP